MSGDRVRQGRIDAVSDRLWHNVRAYGKAWTGEDADTEFIVEPLLAELEMAERDRDLARAELQVRERSQMPVIPRAAAERLRRAEARIAAWEADA